MTKRGKGWTKLQASKERGWRMPKYLSITSDAAAKLTSEEVALLRQDVLDAAAHNKPIRAELVKEWSTLVGLAIGIFGKGSNQYKYLMKNDDQIGIPYYVHLHYPSHEGYFDDWVRRHVTEPQEKARQEANRKQQLSKQEETRLQQVKTIIKIALKHGIDEDELFEVISALEAKDKYLKLATAMFQCRNCGYDYYDAVVRAVNAMTFDKPVDRDIWTDLTEAIERWDGDGRIFRDTTWNYEKLFELADKSLVTDWHTLYEMGRWC
jgi:predicted Zn-ribbon and HTH transcriptional regulator